MFFKPQMNYERCEEYFKDLKIDMKKRLSFQDFLEQVQIPGMDVDRIEHDFKRFYCYDKDSNSISFDKLVNDLFKHTSYKFRKAIWYKNFSVRAKTEWDSTSSVNNSTD